MNEKPVNSLDATTIFKLSASEPLKCGRRQNPKVENLPLNPYSSTGNVCLHLTGESFSSDRITSSSTADPQMTSLSELKEGKSDRSVVHSSRRSINVNP